jgi:hypothetical protein
MTHDHRRLAVEFNQRTRERLDRKQRAGGENHDEWDRASGHYAEARTLGEKIANAEDRRSFFEELAEEPWFGLAREG